MQDTEHLAQSLLCEDLRPSCTELLEQFDDVQRGPILLTARESCDVPPQVFKQLGVVSSCPID